MERKNHQARSWGINNLTIDNWSNSVKSIPILLIIALVFASKTITFVRKAECWKRAKKYVRHAFCALLKNPRNQLQEDTLHHDGDLLIHLRLGDVLNTYINSTEINDTFEYGVSIVPSQIKNMRYRAGNLGWWNYIKFKYYDKNMLSQL